MRTVNGLESQINAAKKLAGSQKNAADAEITRLSDLMKEKTARVTELETLVKQVFVDSAKPLALLVMRAQQNFASPSLIKMRLTCKLQVEGDVQKAENQAKKYLSVFNPAKLKATEWKAQKQAEAEKIKQFESFLGAIQVSKAPSRKGRKSHTKQGEN